MDEPPVKRQRVDAILDKKDEWDPVVPVTDDGFNLKYTREADVGITEFLDQNSQGFDCILKYKYGILWYISDVRYSDFIVNEIGMDGEVVILKDTAYENPSSRGERRANGNATVKNDPMVVSMMTLLLTLDCTDKSALTGPLPPFRIILPRSDITTS